MGKGRRRRSSAGRAREPGAARGAVERTGRAALRARAARGLAVTVGVTALVVFYIHWARPWLEASGLSWHVEEVPLCAFKASLAIGALALLLLEAFLRKMARPWAARARRGVAIGLACAATLGGGAFLASDDMRPYYYAHHWELFHYYLGSKYHSELGYKRIYLCAAVAQSELGPEQQARVRARPMRDLRDDSLVPAAQALADPGACKSHFTPDRWLQFRSDIAFFVSMANQRYWESMNVDHGYNPPPLWTTVAHLFSAHTPATMAGMRFLASIDLALLAGSFFLLWWAFGARVLCIALVFFGTQLPANGFFTGGAFLRQDWLLGLVASVAFARKRRFALAGAALVFSTMLRLFPALLFGGWAVVIAARWMRQRTLAPGHARLLAGSAAALLVLGAWSAAATGPSTYADFFRHIRHHAGVPLSNNMGLPQVIDHWQERTAPIAPASAPGAGPAGWGRRLAAIRWPSVVRWGIVLALGVAFVWIARGQGIWVAGALGVLPVVLLTRLTCYYYAFYLAAAALARARRWAGEALVLCGAASAAAVIWTGPSASWYLRYDTQTVIFLLAGVALLASFAPWQRLRDRLRPVVASGPVEAARRP